MNIIEKKHLLYMQRSRLVFFYKEPVFKRLALRWQIAKQLSVLNPFSLRNNKNNRLKKSGAFPL